MTSCSLVKKIISGLDEPTDSIISEDGQQSSPKCCNISSRPHGVTSQKNKVSFSHYLHASVLAIRINCTRYFIRRQVGDKDEAKLSQELNTQEVTTYPGVEIRIHAFVSSALQWRKRAASGFSFFNSAGSSDTLPNTARLHRCQNSEQPFLTWGPPMSELRTAILNLGPTDVRTQNCHS